MLDNTITLPVDELNNDTTVDAVFTRTNEYQNRSVYEGPAHTLSENELMTLYRTYPKPSGNYKGVAKSAIKFSRDVKVAGADGNDMSGVEIGEISFNLPVGTTAADALILRQRMIAILDNDTIMSKLTERLEV